MPDYVEYRKSISRELLAVKDRVRNLIDDRHWGEDGRYKEIVLMQTLRNHLPDTVRAGSGFVICGGDCTSQIDIIIYSGSVKPFFNTGDFVIVERSGVLGIIEVKTRIDKREFSAALGKAHGNGVLIDKPIFNGIFAYESDLGSCEDTLPCSMKQALVDKHGCVNNIALGEQIFIKHWAEGEVPDNPGEHISFYHLRELAFGYFISNLSDAVSSIELTPEYQRFLYPIQGGKEMYRIENYEIPLTTGGALPCQL
jgi:hypothetical protein